MKAFDEAPTWAKLLFDQISKVNNEVSEIKGQVKTIQANVEHQIQEQSQQIDVIHLKVQAERLKGVNEKLEEDVRRYESKLDEIEQYSRRDCLTFTGIKEDNSRREDNDKLILQICNENLDLNLTIEKISRTHRFISKKNPRGIIVKFINYQDRFDVYRAKSKLKHSGIAIYESLTTRRKALLDRAKEIVGTRNTFSPDGKIFAMKGTRKVRINERKDLDGLIS